ncbi:hypothetical protein [Brevundimonas naejangsanensis]|uniref:hypothetical protein n=1 Tax=Brevundimonas naejangsanensis TaxID=588932 RepID=UPI0039F651C2
MRLDQFIDTALTEIALGVSKAKVRSKDLVAIAPAKLNGQMMHTESQISFDVSLRVASGDETGTSGAAKGGAKMRIVVADADVSVDGQRSTKTTSNEEASHRITFSVPMVLTAHHRADQSMVEEEAVIKSLDPDWTS